MKRERVAESWELKKLQASAPPAVWRLVMLALQSGLRENKLIEIHEEWLVQRADGWWLVPAPGRSRIKGVPKAVPLNGLAYQALCGDVPRIGGRFFSQWKDGNSFKHRWDSTCERAGVHDLHFHDLRHTFATWLMQAGVDYVVIEKLLGHRLPGAGDLYLHHWDGRLRHAANRLETFTIRTFADETTDQLPLTATDCHLPHTNDLLSARNMVPRDRIELSTPAFSGLCSAN